MFNNYYLTKKDIEVSSRKMIQSKRPPGKNLLNNMEGGEEKGDHSHGDQDFFIWNCSHPLEIKDEQSLENSVECQHCEEWHCSSSLEIMEGNQPGNRKRPNHDPGKDAKIVKHHQHGKYSICRQVYMCWNICTCSKWAAPRGRDRQFHTISVIWT